MGTDGSDATDTTIITSSVSNVETLGPLMASGTTTASQVQTITEVSTVRVVRVNDWANANKQAFDAAMAQSSKPINDLQASLAANTAVNARLTEQKVVTKNVVASQIQPDGSMVVYVYDPT